MAIIIGTAGEDVLNGTAFWDFLWGGKGNDILNGGAGNDTLHGAMGDDLLTGGSGRDTFHYGTGVHGNDTITDFVSGVDRLNVDEAYVLAYDGATNTSTVTLPDGVLTLLGVHLLVSDIVI